MEKIANYINGELHAPKNGQYINNLNPAISEVYSLIPESDVEDLNLALDASEKAFPGWSNTSVEERSAILFKIAALITEDLERLALAECTDTGKPLHLAQTVDIPRASANMAYFAHAITQFSQKSHHMTDAINYTLNQPIGVVACISPWNLPLYLFTWKIAPALAAGNCVIAKPSEITPYTAYLFSKICIKAGLPAGVLNILHGTGSQIGNAIIEEPRIKAVSFTGGTETGKTIASISAPMLRKVSLELGGKNPAIVMADTDLESTVKQLVKASFSNQGQICLCASRLIIQDTIYDQFKALFIKEAAKLRVGDPLETKNDLGAIISKTHYQKIKSYIDLAFEEGGKLLLGTKPPKINERCQSGYFLGPHIIEGLSMDSRVNQEEIFGPVVTLTSFKKIEEAIQLANQSDYGLAGTIWTKDLTTAHSIANELQSGIVWVNCWMIRDLRTPFGGMKNSGVGREGGFDALNFFTETKNVCVKF